MSVAEMATMTLVKLKDYTSSTIVKLTHGLTRTEFMRRSRNAFLLCLGIWVCATGLGFLAYRSAVARAGEGFYQSGVQAAHNLTQKSRPFVLDKDVLMLNLVLQSAEKAEGLVYAAVLDHQGLVLARMGSEQAARQLQPFHDHIPAGVRDGVGYSDIIPAGSERFVLFAQPVTYSAVDIGKVIVAQSAAGFEQNLERIKWIFAAASVGLTLLLVVTVLWYDHRKKRAAYDLLQRSQNIEVLGPYHLISKVAQGGMAELYLADCIRDDGFRRRVALKRILPHYAANEEFVQMFIREARLAALLQHPNIVQVFDYGKIADVSFMAMEYVDGKDLGAVIAGSSPGLAIEPAVFIFGEISKGLEYSHARRDEQSGEPLGIVHRDISPHNILISYQGEVKISDFGISKAQTEPNLTQIGTIKGKLMYLAPEQLTGGSVDHRLDLYALGLVFYEAITGTAAYRFASEVEAIQNIPTVSVAPPRTRKASIPVELERIVMKCLAKNPAARYQSAAAVYADLAAFRKQEQISFDSADLAALLQRVFKPAAHA